MCHEPNAGPFWRHIRSNPAYPNAQYIRQTKVTKFDMSVWVEEEVLRKSQCVTRANPVSPYIRFDIAMNEPLLVTLLYRQDHLYTGGE